MNGKIVQVPLFTPSILFRRVNSFSGPTVNVSEITNVLANEMTATHLDHSIVLFYYFIITKPY